MKETEDNTGSAMIVEALHTATEKDVDNYKATIGKILVLMAARNNRNNHKAILAHMLTVQMILGKHIFGEEVEFQMQDE